MSVFSYVPDLCGERWDENVHGATIVYECSRPKGHEGDCVANWVEPKRAESSFVPDRACGHKFRLKRCAVCAVDSADKLVSQLHDALYAFDGQPHSTGGYERQTWERHRDQMNTLIWKLHDVLRAAS